MCTILPGIYPTIKSYISVCVYLIVSPSAMSPSIIFCLSVTINLDFELYLGPDLELDKIVRVAYWIRHHSSNLEIVSWRLECTKSSFSKVIHIDLIVVKVT